MTERFRGLVEAMCLQMKIDNPATVADSGILDIDGESVFLEARADGAEAVLVYADLGKVPEENATEVYRNLLEANLLWAGTGGATIGLHPDTGAAVLAYEMPMDGLTGDGLAAGVEQFARIAGFWRRFIAAGGRVADEDGEAPLPAGPSSGMVRV